ncbi:MAG: hypothetical protein QOH61_1423 [Chloroflexota bacterium]|nr:hypothetical protein [Chloroflexota bacterium]
MTEDGGRVRVERDVHYAGAGHPALVGDLYHPSSSEPAPAVLIVHGGAFKGGSRAALSHWGTWLAGQGFLAFSIDYTLAAHDRSSFPAAVDDARTAVEYLRANAAELHIDPERIAAMGCSAGATIAATLTLTRHGGAAGGVSDHGESDRGGSADVAVAIAVAGVYDLVEQWEHDQLFRPADQQTEIYLGGTPMDARPRFYAASPLVHASRQNAAATRWLLAWGTADDVVSPEQSVVMGRHLNRAGATVRLAPIESAAHFFYLEGRGRAIDATAPTFNGRLAERILTFLRDWCGW